MFYTRIKELRVEHNLTQQAVADILEIKHPQYHRYESGKREIPLHLLIKLADFYGVTLDYIAGRSEDTGAEELGNIG
jgi:hypothetical protein|nr:MAG TPA: Helix-turn-helix XRE-family like protein [Inoviridae sp.]